MGGARKLLSEMLRSKDPRQFTYDDAVTVLSSLGFQAARTKPKGSHRLWRLEVMKGGEKSTLYVGLVDSGNGTIKPVYVKKMLDTLLQNGLIMREDYV